MSTSELICSHCQIPVDDRGCSRCWWMTPLPKVIRRTSLTIHAGGGGPRIITAESLGFTFPANLVNPVTIPSIQCQAGDWLIVTQTIPSPPADWDTDVLWNGVSILTPEFPVGECVFSGSDIGAVMRSYTGRIAQSGNASVVVLESDDTPESRMINIIRVRGAQNCVSFAFPGAEGLSGYPVSGPEGNPTFGNFSVIYHPMREPDSISPSTWTGATQFARDGTDDYTVEIASRAHAGSFSFTINSTSTEPHGHVTVSYT